MSPQKKDLVAETLQALDTLNGGVHPGFRPAHAKGILLTGEFTPSAAGRSLTAAPHVQRDRTRVTVRLSNSSGIPAIPDNRPEASPRGMAIRFHLAEHVHTDIIAHSVDAFPVRTAEEFVEFLSAAGASGPDAPHPTPIEKYVAAHPAALRFVQTPKPFPSTFAKESFFGITAYRFTNEKGQSRFGRYRIRPEGEGEHLDDATAAAKTPNFLFDEIRQRVAAAPIVYRILVQMAGPHDVVDDATISWPEERPQIELGSIALTSLVPNDAAEQRHIIFDPLPRVEGIEPSADPLLDPRADVYLASGRRRRAGATE